MGGAVSAPYIGTRQNEGRRGKLCGKWEARGNLCLHARGAVNDLGCHRMFFI